VINFDWEVPRQPDCIVFQLRLERRSQHSAIDLRRMRKAGLEHLYNFLAKRHAGLDHSHELTRAITWLLTVSLQQQQPDMSNSKSRALQVRQLLLART
jgi:hypothetical protein